MNCPHLARYPIRLSLLRAIRWLIVALLQFGDELFGDSRLGGGTRAHLPVIMEGGAGIVRCITDPSISSEDLGNMMANCSSSVNVSLGFMVLYGLVVMAQRLAGVTERTVDVAELLL